MKYVLILSLFYKHYKKSSTLKIFLDDRFVDEIVLDKHIEHIDNVEELHAETIDNIAKDINKSKDWERTVSRTVMIISERCQQK